MSAVPRYWKASPSLGTNFSANRCLRIRNHNNDSKFFDAAIDVVRFLFRQLAVIDERVFRRALAIWGGTCRSCTFCVTWCCCFADTKKTKISRVPFVVAAPACRREDACRIACPTSIGLMGSLFKGIRSWSSKNVPPPWNSCGELSIMLTETNPKSRCRGCPAPISTPASVLVATVVAAVTLLLLVLFVALYRITKAS